MTVKELTNSPAAAPLPVEFRSSDLVAAIANCYRWTGRPQRRSALQPGARGRRRHAWTARSAVAPGALQHPALYGVATGEDELLVLLRAHHPELPADGTASISPDARASSRTRSRSGCHAGYWIFDRGRTQPSLRLLAGRCGLALVSNGLHGTAHIMPRKCCSWSASAAKHDFAGRTCGLR